MKLNARNYVKNSKSLNSEIVRQVGGWVVRRCLVFCVKLILSYNWARSVILVAGKGRGRMFLFLLFLTFIPVPLSSCPSLSSLLSLFSLSLGDNTK